ncbi:hypothetical protein V6N13_051339 [Hibiscus sabdariffa]
MNGAMGLQLGGCIGKAIGLTTESRVKAVAGPRRKQGIEYFDTGRVSAKAAATTVGETSARCAGSGAPLNGGSEAPLNGAVHEEEGTDNAPSAAAETGTNSQGNGLAQAASMTDGTDQSAPDSTMPNKTAEDDHCAESVFAAMVAADSAAAQLVSAAPAHNSKRTIQGRYEVCHPIQAKRAKLPLNPNGIDSGTRNTGMSSINSPTEVVEVHGQPRRAS